MGTELHQSPEADLRRRKRRGWLIIGACFAGLLALFGWSLFGPNPPLVISKQTTYITSPLRPDGTPDYEAYLLSKQNRKLPREENAAVVMWQMMGPHHGYFSREKWPDLEVELGDLSPPPGIERFAELPEYGSIEALEEWREQQKSFRISRFGKREFERLNVDFPAAELPWQRTDIPPLADWLIAHEAAFDCLCEGAARPGYFSPPSNDLTLSIALDMHAMRACLAWGENDPKRAVDHLVAMIRWRTHFESNVQFDDALPTFTAQFASTLVRNFVGDAQMETADLRRLQQALLFSPSEKVLLLNRFKRMRIDVIQDILDGFEIPDVTLQESYRQLLNRVDRIYATFRTDINLTLELINELFDRAEQIAGIKNYAQRQQAIKELSTDIEENLERSERTCDSLRVLFPLTRNHALASIRLWDSAAPMATPLLAYQDNILAERQLTLVAVALAIHHAEHGEYPETLADLQPALSPDLKMDTFHGKPLAYQRTGDGYLLHSFGPNSIDDGGDTHSAAIAAQPGRYLKAGIEIAHSDTKAISKINVTADDFASRVPVSFATWRWEVDKDTKGTEGAVELSAP
jgi:hypothetical protein